ncbi:MAG: sufurtransferase FdhD [Gaiellales bacterium]|nr:MAG: sufurtransferase FdhD [Gaiellales bacterium]
MVNRGYEQRESCDWGDGSAEAGWTDLPVEAAVQLRVDGRHLATLHCTPQHLDELARGFLLGQGYVATPEDIAAVEVGADGVIEVALAGEGLKAEPAPAHRIVYSGCGQPAGQGDIGAIQSSREEERTLSPRVLRGALEETLRHGEIYRETRGVHSAGLFSCEGLSLALREDIGRHNAFDKVLGWLSGETGLITGTIFAASSGRISSEAVRKMARFGIPVVISKGVPTTMAADEARRLGVTLASSLGPARLRLYSHRYRVSP